MDYYIDPTHTGQQTGTIEEPFISRNQVPLKDGDTVYIKRDTEMEDGQYNIVRSNTKWKAYGEGALPIIKADGEYVFSINGRPNTSLSDLELISINGRGINVVGCDDIEFDNLVVNNCNHGIFITASNSPIDGITVKNCEIYNCVNSVTIRMSGEGNGVSDIQITNNYIHDNTQHGIRLYSSRKEELGNAAKNVRVENNTCQNNGKAGITIGFIIEGDKYQNTCSYNLCSGNSWDETTGNLQVYNATNIIIEYNECYDAKTNGVDGVDIILDATGWGNLGGPTPAVHDSIIRYNYCHDTHSQPYSNPNKGGSGIFMLKSKRCQVYGNRVERNQNGIILGKYCVDNNVHSNLIMDIERHAIGVVMVGSETSQVHDNFMISTKEIETVEIAK